MIWQNKKNFDLSSLIFDSRNFQAASLKGVLDTFRIGKTMTCDLCFVPAAQKDQFPQLL